MEFKKSPVCTYLCGFIVILYTGEVRTGGCDKIEISGSSYQESRMGLYTEMSSGKWCARRPTYDMTNDNGHTNYLFYHESEDDDFEGWLVGTSRCEGVAGLKVEDDAKYPENINKKWKELYLDNWWINNHLKAKCLNDDISLVQVAGIIVGAIILIAIAMFIVVCCLKHRAKINSEAARSGRIGVNNNNIWAIRSPRTVRPIAPPSYNAHIHDSSNPSTYRGTLSQPNTSRSIPCEPAPQYRSPTPGFARAHNMDIFSVRAPVSQNNNNHHTTAAAVEYSLTDHPLSPPPAYEDAVAIGSERTHTSLDTELESLHSDDEYNALPGGTNNHRNPNPRTSAAISRETRF